MLLDFTVDMKHTSFRSNVCSLIYMTEEGYVTNVHLMRTLNYPYLTTQATNMAFSAGELWWRTIVWLTVFPESFITNITVNSYNYLKKNLRIIYISSKFS